MFNKKYKKESLANLEKSIEIYNETSTIVQKKAEELFFIRKDSGEKVIRHVEEYINLLANSPKEFDRSFSEYKVEFKTFNDLIETFEAESLDTTVKAGGPAPAATPATAVPDRKSVV